jgi:outer membrane protein assembly factor BamB
MEINNHTEVCLVLLLIISFIFLPINSLVLGLDIKLEDIKIRDNLSFYFFDDNSLNKIKYYERLLQVNDSFDVLSEESIISEESSPTISYGPINSAWPMQSHDTHHTGRSLYSTTHVDGFEKWRFECDTLDSTPVIDDNGIIYFGGGYNGLPWYLYAVYPNGTLKWKYKTSGLMLGSSPAIAEDGIIYVGTWDTGLYAINPDGTKKWRTGSGGSIASSPAIAEDGTIFVGTMNTGNSLVAFYPNGTIRWKYKTGYSITGGPAIGSDDTIYIGSGDNYFYAINSNGTLKWRYKTGHYIKGHASIADDGTVYIGSWDDYLYAFYPHNGTVKWKCKVGMGTETNPSIAEDGTIYVGGNKLWAIYPNGTKRWTFDLGAGRHIHKSSPAISSDGTIYVGTNINETDGGDIIAVNPDGTLKWRKKIAKDWVDSSPSIAEDGTVYIGGTYDLDYETGYLHAFGPKESNDPPDAPSISGEANGKPRTEYTYTFKPTDPDNNPVKLYIDWGDGNIIDWSREYAPNEVVKHKHTYIKQGSYTIKAKTKDNSGEEGPWGYLEVNIPRTKVTPLQWYQWFLERFPNAFPILRQILGLI